MAAVPAPAPSASTPALAPLSPGAVAATDKLATAVLQSFNDPLQTLVAPLQDLSEEQQQWQRKVLAQVDALKALDGDLNQIEPLFARIPEYLTKLTLLQRDMIMLENKAIDLNRRSAALVEAKKKQLEKEARLSAQPSSSFNPSS